MRRSSLRPEAPEQMSDITTPEGCEPSATAKPTAATRSRSLPQAPVLSRLLTVYGLWTAAAVLYWPSAVALNALWTSFAQKEPFTHGYLVLLLSLWLIWRDRRQLAAVPLRPVPRALIALALLSALWVWAWRAVIQEAHVMLLPLILLAAIVAALGWRAARMLAFPVGYLYFAMPMWSAINGYVQTLSARMSAVLIWITGLPAYVQGVYVHLPGGTIEIAGTCSGLHELMVGLALATFYGEICREPLKRRLKLIGVMGALSLLVNWVRIFTVFVAAYFTDMRSSLVKDHYWLGWWLFAAVFALFLWWAERRPATGDKPQGPQTPRAKEPAPGRPLKLAPVAVALGVMAVLPALAYAMDWAHSGDPAVGIDWPTAPSGWSGPRPVRGGTWRPHFVRPDGESLVSYTNADGERVEAFSVAYRAQTQNAKLLSYWNHLLGEKGRLRSESVRIVSSPSGQWRQTLAVGASGTRSLIWVRYRVGDRFFVRPRVSQLWYGLAALAGRPLYSLTALRAVCTPDCKAARSRLSAKAMDLQPSFR